MEGLGINLPGLITQIVSFLILFGVLYVLLYKPILKMLDQRSTRIKESLETADRVREEAAKSQKDMEKQLLAAREEGQALIAQARQAADRYREEEMVKAKQEIVKEREKAQGEIKREKDMALEELKREFADLAITAAEKVIERSLDKKAHQELIQKVLQESTSKSKN